MAKKCVICGKLFKPMKWNSSACSDECKQAKRKKDTKRYLEVKELKKLDNAEHERVLIMRQIQRNGGLMECPFESGRLPRSVTANQCYG